SPPLRSSCFPYTTLFRSTLTEWFQSIPRNLFKSFTFDNGKEFSNWKVLSNKHDVSIYFADPGTPSQRGLNEHSNGLFRNDGLPRSEEHTSELQSRFDLVC